MGVGVILDVGVISVEYGTCRCRPAVLSTLRLSNTSRIPSTFRPLQKGAEGVKEGIGCGWVGLQ